MRQIGVLLIVALAVLTATTALHAFRSGPSSVQVPKRILEAFSRWQQKHAKLYATPAEQGHRLNVFFDQTLFIEQKNKEYDQHAKAAGVVLSGPAHEMNMFGDLSNEEFKAAFTGAMPIDAEFLEQTVLDEEQIKELEEKSKNPKWTEKTSLGQGWYPHRIRHQGGCGSCWAFAAIPEMERWIFNNWGGQYIDLSQQELVDCVQGSNGCHGGHPEYAFNYMVQNGIHKASDYPYIANKADCRNWMGGKINFGGFTTSNFHGFNAHKAQTASNHRIQASVMVKAEGAFRYQANNRDVYDAKWSGECNQGITHAVAMWEFNGDVANVINSWGHGWGNNGMKFIRTCAHDNLWGNNGRISYPYNFF
jgi:hypothetical protein